LQGAARRCEPKPRQKARQWALAYFETFAVKLCSSGSFIPRSQTAQHFISTYAAPMWLPLPRGAGE
jgi:hypothetical protein